jgi:hypothetical protein
MNIKIYILLAISVFLLLSACSRKGGSDGVDMKEVIIVEDLTPEEKEKLFKSSGILFRENQTLADNLARIETTRNAQGMKIEKYFYNNLPSLQYIEIFTLANGQKQIAIHNANGSVKNLSENSLAWLAKASPEEITGEATVAAEQQKENSSSGGITINKLPPIVINSSPLPSSNQKIEEPKTEKPNETNTKTEDKKDSPKVAASPNH